MTREEASNYLRSFKLCTPYTMDAQGVFYRAVEVALEALDKCDKIEEIINDWDGTPWGTSRELLHATLLRIDDVLEKEEEYKSETRRSNQDPARDEGRESQS